MAEVAEEPNTLSLQFKRSSKDVHRTSDALVSAKLLFAFADPVLFGRAIANFYYVYQALEKLVVKHKKVKEIDPLQKLLSKMYRTPEFQKDLVFFLGEDWEPSFKKSAGLENYLEHLDSISNKDPGLLLAHVWTQYNSLLAGGQILKRMARKALKLSDEQGTAFLTFGEDGGKDIKKELKRVVDALGKKMSEQRTQQLVDEHVTVFHLNNAILRDYRVGWYGVRKAATRLMPILQIAVVVWVVLVTVAYVMLSRRYGYSWPVDGVRYVVEGVWYYVSDVYHSWSTSFRVALAQTKYIMQHRFLNRMTEEEFDRLMKAALSELNRGAVTAPEAVAQAVEQATGHQEL